MTTDTGLAGLIERLEKGSGEMHYTLADDIARIVHGPKFSFSQSYEIKEAAQSLDAALAFAESQCPGWLWHLTNRGYDDGVCLDQAAFELHHPTSSGGGPFWRGVHQSQARAVLIAVLSALSKDMPDAQ